MKPFGTAFQSISGFPGENMMSSDSARLSFRRAMRKPSLEKYSSGGMSLGSVQASRMTQFRAVKHHSLFGRLAYSSSGMNVQISTMDLWLSRLVIPGGSQQI